jgi:hypothetical protein
MYNIPRAVDILLSDHYEIETLGDLSNENIKSSCCSLS